MHHAFDSGDPAPAWPKSTCMLPGAHSNSAKPSDSMRCSRRQRLTQRRTDEYEPVNPHSATSRSYTRVAVWRCLTGMRRSAAGHPSTTAEYPASTSDLPACPEPSGLGE
ncbi:putative 30S ribosomal protein S8 [Bifidobacterium longum subsp. longum JDM301]|uniref:Putative 30S ribosomal protein S8 n=1 Tax=Bifidobacterium longum subsp. longum (strain JDM301) TaxID=759350 RepID=D6ZWP4_BIFLJ|nr:putative 30S ribosomal protein S8 [Bifidobacterium longum subsp. longum JDM301]